MASKTMNPGSSSYLINSKIDSESHLSDLYFAQVAFVQPALGNGVVNRLGLGRVVHAVGLQIMLQRL